jgi:heptosyltransferase-1
MALAPRSLEERKKAGSSVKALIVRFSAIGDCVMAVPVAASIRAKYPDAHIEWAVEPYCSPVIDTKKLVQNIVLFPRDEWEQQRWSPRTWRNQLGTYASMRGRNFDIGIDLQGQAKTALCLKLAKPKKRIAAKGHDFLSDKLNPIFETTRGQMHTIEHAMLTLQQLGDFSTEVKFVMPDLIEEQETVRAMFSKDKPLVTISISAGGQKKLYPAERWEEVARGLMNRGVQVAFLGGPKDEPLPLKGSLDWIGKLNLREAMAAVKLSAVHLAADTGTGHMAAAYNVPVVSVFGKTKPYWYRPYTTNGVVLDGKGSTLNISPDQVLEAAERLLERNSEAISS